MRCKRLSWRSLSVVVLLSLTPVLVTPADAQKPKPWQLPQVKTKQDKLRILGTMKGQFQNRSSRSFYTSSRLTDDLDKYIKRATRTPIADVVDDAAFIRRVTLDLTGHAPKPADIKAFEADTDRKKRDKLVDKLVHTDAWARKVARYWREVIFHNSPAIPNRTNPKALEDWLFQQFKDDRGWDEITAELVFATPRRLPNRKDNQNGWQQDDGANNFVLSCNMQPTHLASRTARLFMGISIECAECHDHPFDNWKREQFHELAAFFSNGKYFMPDAEDPKKRHQMQARFLLGEKPVENLSRDQRRVVIAAYLVYNPDNYWFSRAFVNRVWSEMLGDGFYNVDSLGPDAEVVHKLTVNKLSAQFRGKSFNVRWLYQLIAKSEIYQRQANPPETTRDLFTTVRATRLRPYEVADRVADVAGFEKNLNRQLVRTFQQDPSIPHRDLESSVQQALILMNNGGLYGRLFKSGDFKKTLAKKRDVDVIEDLFLKILARRPTSEERTRHQSYFRSAKNRYEAATDLAWVLINSAEFLTNT